MNPDSLLYHIALTQVPHIGDVQISNLLNHCIEPEAVFKANRKQLELIPGIGSIRASEIKKFKSFERIENEIKYVEENKINILVKGHNAYPTRLEECQDGAGREVAASHVRIVLAHAGVPAGNRHHGPGGGANEHIPAGCCQGVASEPRRR